MLEINKSQIIYARDRKALDNARAPEKNEPPADGNNSLSASQGSIKSVVYKKYIVNSSYLITFQLWNEQT
jgi:hypothetical protein